MTAPPAPPALSAALVTATATVEKLVATSRQRFENPYTAVEWPESVDPEADWFFSPELSSLHGTPYWDELDEAGRRRLAFHEAANFFSLNIHGEKMLIEGLSERLYRPDLMSVVEYLHHFLDEENKHSVWFGGFCRRYARVYPSRHVRLPPLPGAADLFGAIGGALAGDGGGTGGGGTGAAARPYDPTAARNRADLLFFAKVLIFEEHADRYNVLQSKDARLHPLARFINAAHHADESRHLVFNRTLVTALREVLAPVSDARDHEDTTAHLAQFLTTTWREYYNPDVYADCGLANPWQVAEDAWNSPAQRAHRRRVSAKCLRFLTAAELLPEEPADVF